MPALKTAATTATRRTDLSRLLNPRGVAVVGVSNDVTRIGGQALSLLTDFGYAGRIYPVNPKYGDINGLTCYPDLLSVPQPCDVALIALSAERVTGKSSSAARPESRSRSCSLAASAKRGKKASACKRN